MNNPSTAKRIEEVDILRGLAAVLMVLGHSFIEYPIDISGNPVCVAIGHFIYTFHMELFFVLAGFVYRCKSYKQFIGKKIKRILVPYLLFGSVFAILHAFGGAAINGQESLNIGLFKLIFSGGGYWFLYVSFLIFLIFPLIERIFTSNMHLVCIASLCLVVTQFFDLPSIFAMSSVAKYLPYFITGYCIAKCQGINFSEQASASRLKRTLIWMIPAVIFCALDAIEVCGEYEFGSICHYIRAMAIIMVLGCLAHTCNVVFHQNRIWKALHNLLADCSLYSLQIYLFNGYLMTILRIIICQLLHITTPFVIVLGIWLGDLFLTLILCKYVCKKVRFFSVLCGMQ